MNVMMIGHSGAGKTSYMAAMYGCLSGGIARFSIEADNIAQHNGLIQVYNKLLEGEYPDSTDIKSEYEFQLLYNNRKVLDFNWLDYRGGLLLENTKNSAEAKQLQSLMNKVNAVIIFFDGEKLMEDDYDVHMEYRRTQMFIQHIITNLKKDRIIPISLVITKGDAPEFDLSQSPVFEYIQKIVGAMLNNMQIAFLCTTTIINQSEIINVQYPFLWSMYYGLVNARQRTEAQLNKHLEKAHHHESNSGLFDDLVSFFVGEPSHQDLARDEFDKARKKVNKHDKLLKHANHLVDILNDAYNKEHILIKTV